MDSRLRLWLPHERPPECLGCPRNQPGRSRGFVPGYGSPTPNIFVIMEQPGEREVGEGSPAIWKSGEELDTGLGGREDVFVTNIRKCIGADHEKPAIRAGSIAHCVRAYLVPEIERVGAFAKSFLCMGADSVGTVVGARSAIKAHGSVWSSEEANSIRNATSPGSPIVLPKDTRVIASLHPAFAMRGMPQFRDEIRRVIRRAANHGRGLGGPLFRPRPYFHTPPDLWHRAAREVGMLVVDLETDYETGKEIKIIGMQAGEHLMVAPASPDMMLVLKEIAEDASLTKVGHNFAFDMSAMRANLIKPAYPVYDTINMASLLWPPRPRSDSGGKGKSDVRWLSLASCVLRVLDGVAYWKQPESDYTQAFFRAAYPDIPLPLHPLLYCGLDVAYNFKLFEALRWLLINEGMWELFNEITSPAGFVLSEMEERGLLLDTVLRDELRETSQKRVGDLAAGLAQETTTAHEARVQRVKDAIVGLEGDLAKVEREALAQLSGSDWTAKVEELSCVRRDMEVKPRKRVVRKVRRSESKSPDGEEEAPLDRGGVQHGEQGALEMVLVHAPEARADREDTNGSGEGGRGLDPSAGEEESRPEDLEAVHGDEQAPAQTE